MPFKPPLTFDELRAISARSPAGSDGRALLWEIKRLQDRLRRVAQYLHGGSSQYGVIYDALITELNGEPAVQDWCADHRDGVPLGMQRNPADGVPDPVRQEVGNSKYQLPDAIEPVPPMPAA